MGQKIDPPIEPAEQKAIDPNNVGAQLFMTQLVELFLAGNTEIEVEYAKQTGEKGKIKVTLEAIE